MSGRGRSGAGLFLIELTIAVAVFAFSAGICLRLFAGAAASTRHSAAYGDAVRIAQNAAEAMQAGASGLPARWNDAGAPDKNGAYRLALATQTAQDGLTDAAVTVSDADGEALFTLEFTCGEAVS